MSNLTEQDREDVRKEAMDFFRSVVNAVNSTSDFIRKKQDLDERLRAKPSNDKERHVLQKTRAVFQLILGEEFLWDTDVFLRLRLSSSHLVPRVVQDLNHCYTVPAMDLFVENGIGDYYYLNQNTMMSFKPACCFSEDEILNARLNTVLAMLHLIHIQIGWKHTEDNVNFRPLLHMKKCHVFALTAHSYYESPLYHSQKSISNKYKEHGVREVALWNRSVTYLQLKERFEVALRARRSRMKNLKRKIGGQGCLITVQDCLAWTCQEKETKPKECKDVFCDAKQFETMARSSPTDSESFCNQQESTETTMSLSKAPANDLSSPALGNDEKESAEPDLMEGIPFDYSGIKPPNNFM